MPQPILIGVLSAFGYEDRRSLCRATWFRPEPPTWDAVFLVGCQQVDDQPVTEPTRKGDFLYLPCPDDYTHLPQKSRLFCQWALTQPDWTYLYKTDDDGWTHIPRLLAYDPQGADLAGVEWRKGCGYASGAGYLLSRRAAEIVATALKAQTGAEDALVAHVLAKEGISMRHERERFLAFATLQKRPMRGNQLINAHVGCGQRNWEKNGEALFRACHEEFAAETTRTP